MASLLVISLGVGMLIGAVGVGGILLIPALTLYGGLPIHQAMATALFSFIFTGVVGTVLFQRRGSIPWRIALPVCAGGLVSGFLGAWANSKLDASVLSLLLAALIVFAGVYTLYRREGARHAFLDDHPARQRALLVGIGAVAGFGSGLTGVGGPALSVPIMVFCGFAPLASIGTSQVIQILAAVSGTLGNLRYGSIDFSLAAIVTIVEILGVYLGVRIVHAVNAHSLRRFVGALCLAVGSGLALHSLHVF